MSTLPRLITNPCLTGEKGEKVYNAHYRGSNILLTPVVQRPSGMLTYMWRHTYWHHSEARGPFDSPKLALAAAVATIA